jgi:uncharacterized protein (DUF1697 family)
MNFSKYMDVATAEFIDVTVSVLKKFRESWYEYNKVLGLYLKKEISKMSRGRVKAILRQMENEKIHDESDEVFENEVFTKVFFILESHGFNNVAKDLGTVLNRQMAEKLSQDLIYEKISENAARKSRSVAASGSRHSQKEEIIDVIRETWIAFPWGSRNKMVTYVIEHYRVVNKTVRTWMKEEGLAPLEDVKTKKFHLIIPEKWKK